MTAPRRSTVCGYALVLAAACLWATLGLQHIRTSNASILATAEPVVAAVLAWLVLGEALAWPQLAGGACVLLAVALLVRTGAARQAGSIRPATMQTDS